MAYNGAGALALAEQFRPQIVARGDAVTARPASAASYETQRRGTTEQDRGQAA
jgi:hypothetical protein